MRGSDTRRLHLLSPGTAMLGALAAALSARAKDSGLAAEAGRRLECAERGFAPALYPSGRAFSAKEQQWTSSIPSAQKTT